MKDDVRGFEEEDGIDFGGDAGKLDVDLYV